MDKDRSTPPSGSSGNAKISFRPVSEGLGFHPFSDGLPYAPIGKNPKPVGINGTGAIAAGPPRVVSKIIVPPKPPVVQPHKISVPVVQPPKIGVPPVEPQIQLPKGATETRSLGIAYLATRFLAYLFDVSFNSLLMGGVLVGLVWNGYVSIDVLLNYGVPAGAGVFFLASSWIGVALQEILFRRSLGKYLFHLKFRGSRIKILFRTLIFPLSLGVFGLGILWSLFHQRRSCWHDLLSGTQPLDCTLDCTSGL